MPNMWAILGVVNVVPIMNNTNRWSAQLVGAQLNATQEEPYYTRILDSCCFLHTNVFDIDFLSAKTVFLRRRDILSSH